MSRNETRSYDSITPRESSRFTDAEYIVLDITYPVRKFVDWIDSRVDDLGYSIEGVLLMHAKYGRSFIASRALSDLAGELYSSKTVRNRDDSHLIADCVLSRLFPEIRKMLQELGYSMSLIHQVHLTETSHKQLHCRALFAVM